MQDFGTCPKYSFLRCEIKPSWRYGAKPDGCAADWIDTFDEREVNLLQKDIADRKYAVVTAAATTFLLNVQDPKVFDEFGGSHTSWQAYIGHHGGYPLAQLPKIPIESKPLPADVNPLSVVRGSGFMHHCDIQRLLSKLDTGDTELALIGRTLHKIINKGLKPYVHDALLKRINEDSGSVLDYAEREIFCKLWGVPFLGHPDLILDIGNGFGLGIVDFKRSGPRPGYTFQTGSYAVAVNQEYFNNAYERYFLINAIHARPNEPISDTNPFHVITMVRRNGHFVRKMREEVEKTYHRQQELRARFGEFEREKARMELNGTCADCFENLKGYCDSLKAGGLSLDERLEMLKRPV